MRVVAAGVQQEAKRQEICFEMLRALHRLPLKKLKNLLSCYRSRGDWETRKRLHNHLLSPASSPPDQCPRQRRRVSLSVSFETYSLFPLTCYLLRCPRQRNEVPRQTASQSEQSEQSNNPNNRTIRTIEQSEQYMIYVW